MNDAAPEQRRQVARCGGTALFGGPKRHAADRAEGPRPVGFWKESATDQKQRYDAEKISSLNPRRSSERAGVEYSTSPVCTFAYARPERRSLIALSLVPAGESRPASLMLYSPISYCGEMNSF
jgi:hypothetical protein